MPSKLHWKASGATPFAPSRSWKANVRAAGWSSTRVTVAPPWSLPESRRATRVNSSGPSALGRVMSAWIVVARPYGFDTESFVAAAASSSITSDGSRTTSVVPLPVASVPEA